MRFELITSPSGGSHTSSPCYIGNHEAYQAMYYKTKHSWAQQSCSRFFGVVANYTVLSAWYWIVLLCWSGYVSVNLCDTLNHKWFRSLLLNFRFCEPEPHCIILVSKLWSTENHFQEETLCILYISWFVWKHWTLLSMNKTRKASIWQALFII